ncbi:hypothetical protein GO283_05030 [Ralstonia solanacearum]|nr:hypothetical protein [Ralstonia solanacearum]
MPFHDLFQQRIVKGKRVLVVDRHNKAFAAWALVRRELPSAPVLITIDHHTDTIEAFNDIAYRISKATGKDRNCIEKLLVSRIDWRDNFSVRKAVRNLDHDEHIMAATLSGVLRCAFVIQLSDMYGTPSIEQEKYWREQPTWDPLTSPRTEPPGRPFTFAPRKDGVYTISHECAIGCTKSCHDDACLVAHADQILESAYLDDQLARGEEMAAAVGMNSIDAAPYILDIDLDVFHTRKAMQPSDASTLHRLIKGALVITIATEEECFCDEWLDSDPAPPIGEVLDGMLGHIKAAL